MKQRKTTSERSIRVAVVDSEAPDREISKPGESWKSNRAPRLAACGSVPRLKKSLQPLVLPMDC